MSEPRFLLHYAPWSRAQRALWLLEEARLPYALVEHDLQKGTHKRAEYLGLNPDGKVPALVDRGPEGGGGKWPVVVTESAAICLYVADLSGDAYLAPPVGSPDRAAYMTWLVYAASVLEPAFADMVYGRAETPRPGSIGWPPFAEAVERCGQALEQRGGEAPYLLGERFSAADIMVGGMLGWVVAWNKIEATPAIRRYLDALNARPAHQRAEAKQAEIIAARQAAAQ
ncbi:MAG: glutathione S-transferase family protein [Myxococcales bacterium]|nr:glutathione S-transferase family protein [Myxococcales bacterium]MCB9736014.1 glutathione S-transferase family protein [Deltaproteobacteria bacterium]